MANSKNQCFLALLVLTLFYCEIARAEQLENFTNSIGMKFVHIPAGAFVMGENPPLSEGKEMKGQRMKLQ